MKKFLFIAGLVTVLAGAGWCVKAWMVWTANARTSKLREDFDNLFVGLQEYKKRVGSYPIGSNVDVARSLNGENPKNVFIMVNRKAESNSKGEIVDPWGTALRFYFSADGVLIRSAGPNRTFDDSTSMNFDDFIRSN